MNEQEREQIKGWYANECVSEGTLVTEDLIPKFLDVAMEIAEKLEDVRLVCRIRDIRTEVGILEREGEDEALDVLLNEDLMELLDDLAPEGYYFGANEGDGACFGFWECKEPMLDIEPAPKYTESELYHAFVNMRKLGGSFALRLADAWFYADDENRQKIEETWPDLVEVYLGAS